MHKNKRHYAETSEWAIDFFGTFINALPSCGQKRRFIYK
jgi:hypothetical protein